jgi:hypothetical protein
MLALLSELFSWLACRLRGRAVLELEVIALRHQLAVLRRQRPGRPRLFSLDRLLWVARQTTRFWATGHADPIFGNDTCSPQKYHDVQAARTLNAYS